VIQSVTLKKWQVRHGFHQCEITKLHVAHTETLWKIKCGIGHIHFHKCSKFGMVIIKHKKRPADSQQYYQTETWWCHCGSHYTLCSKEMKTSILVILTSFKTTTTTTVLQPPGLCLGLPGWAGTRKVKPIWIYWSKRQWVAVASAGPYTNLHLAPDR